MAHTIELDNEAEHRLPHRTTRAGDAEGRGDAPWLVSSVLWSVVLQQVGAPGITVAELRTRARTSQLLLGGLRRWGYVVVTPPAGEALRNPPQDAAIVCTTEVTRRAGVVWRSLPPVIEGRWRSRFGDEAVDHLQRSLRPIFGRLPFDPPAFLPVVAPTRNGEVGTDALDRGGHCGNGRVSTADLSQLLSGVLLGFTVDFERKSRISLPISANTLRVLGPSGVRIRDLPRLTGVSREANAMCAGWLERHGCAMAQTDPAAARGKVLRLTEKGCTSAAEVPSPAPCHGSSVGIDVRCGHRQRPPGGARACRRGRDPRTFAPRGGLDPYPSNLAGRRAATADTLPHHPMVLHRGGYPDGS